jgi:hypothetical protein
MSSTPGAKGIDRDQHVLLYTVTLMRTDAIRQLIQLKTGRARIGIDSYYPFILAADPKFCPRLTMTIEKQNDMATRNRLMLFALGASSGLGRNIAHALGLSLSKHEERTSRMGNIRRGLLKPSRAPMFASSKISMEAPTNRQTTSFAAYCFSSVH